MAAIAKPLPQPTPEAQEYWDGLRRGDLRIQRCNACGRGYFYPRPFCPRAGCHSRDVEWITASGKATLATYIITHRGHPAFEAPYVIALVELEEGGRMMTNIVGLEDLEPANLPVGAPVEIVFQPSEEDITLPMFRLV